MSYQFKLNDGQGGGIMRSHIETASAALATLRKVFGNGVTVESVRPIGKWEP